MILVPANSRQTVPIVSVRKPSRQQRCIALNSSLALQARLEAYTHLAIDHDPKARKLTFIPSKTGTYQGQPIHLLQKDGGTSSAGRAVFVHVSALPPNVVPTKRYPANLAAGTGGKFWITY